MTNFCKGCECLSFVDKSDNERTFLRTIWESTIKKRSTPYGVSIINSPSQINNTLIHDEKDLILSQVWTTLNDTDNYRPDWIQRGIAEVMFHNGCVILKGMSWPDNFFSISCTGAEGFKRHGKCNIKYCEKNVTKFEEIMK